MGFSKFPENGRLSGESERIAAEGRRYSPVARFLACFICSHIFVRFFGPGKSTHIAAEGRQFLNSIEPCLQATTEKRDRLFAKMSVSRTREGRFRVRAETPFFNSGEGQLAFFVPWRRRELQKWGSAGVEKGPISGVHFAPMSVSRRRERDFGEKRTNFARLSKKRCGDKPQSGPRRTPPKCRSVNTLQHFWPFSDFGRFSVF